jgi:hypothetical protein
MNQRTVACATCGQEFQHIVRAGTQPRYCSGQCRRRATWERRKIRRDSVTEQRCPRCGMTKPIAEFSSMTQAYCRPCHASYARELRKARTPEQRASTRITENAYRHGISAQELLALVDQQGSRCAICTADLVDDARSWHVDHDHSCCPNTSGDRGRNRKRGCGLCIRGILCANCNVGIGMFNDSPVALRAAAAYLERFTSPAT